MPPDFTPETNAEIERQRQAYDRARKAYWPPFPASLEFCRNMERQRDAARAEVKQLQSEIAALQNRVDELIAKRRRGKKGERA